MKLHALHLSLFCFLPLGVFCQNLVMDVTGRVTEKNRKNSAAIKKGDELNNIVQLEFTPDRRYPQPEIKLLTQKGIALIRFGDYQTHSHLELADLIKETIHHNSIAILGTRGIVANPTAARQVQIIDSLCQRLNASHSNIELIASTYINPYCTAAFKNPFWNDIGEMLFRKYGFILYNGMGSIANEGQYNSMPKIAKVTTRDIIPASYSLKKYCPTPGNQGSYGTCVGWASAYGVRTISWAIKCNNTVTSDINNQAFSPTYVYEQIKQGTDYNCQKGASIYDAVALLKNKGTPFYSDLNFGCGVNLSPYTEIAQKFAIKDFYGMTKKFGLAKNDVDFQYDLANIKRALAEKKPILATIFCYQSFGGTTWNGALDINRGLHAICIVGYDDNFSSDGGAVELMNSWGPYWGNGGFIYVKYKDLRNILTSAIALYDDANPEPLKPHRETTRDDPKPPRADTTKYMQGSLSLLLKDGTPMPVKATVIGMRGLKLVGVDEMNYEVTTPYSSGTRFKIKFTSDQPAYVYVVAGDATKSPISQLFPDPDSNISALLDFTTSVSVAIPDGEQYIQMDETAGEDYLCIIYSKNPLDIAAVKGALKEHPEKSFVRTIKEALGNNIINNQEINFQSQQVAFKAKSNENAAVPIFIKIKHY